MLIAIRDMRQAKEQVQEMERAMKEVAAKAQELTAMASSLRNREDEVPL